MREGLKRQWPLLLVMAGELVLIQSTFTGQGPNWIDPIAWVVGTALLFISTLLLFLIGDARPHVRAVAVGSMILFACVRSIDYLTRGVTSPLGVWLIVIGLAIFIGRPSQHSAQSRK